MSRCAIIEAVYDGMVKRGLNPEHEAFEDILMAVSEAAAAEGDPFDWVVENDPGRTPTQIWLDWRTYLNSCSKKTVQLGALLAALREEGSAYAD